MLKLTKTGIGLLTKQYRSVLRKCLLINIGLFASTIFLLSSEQQDAWASITYENNDYILKLTTYNNYHVNNGIWIDDASGQGVVRIIDDVASGGFMELISPNGQVSTALTTNYFRLNNSSTVATGIDSNAIQNSTALITSGGVYDALNYYYTFRVDERVEVIDSASFFQKDFSTLQEVDLQSKNPTHLGAFIKCDEACPRPLERFSLSLSQEQMLNNDASVDAGTFSICNLQIENVNEKLSNVFEA